MMKYGRNDGHGSMWSFADGATNLWVEFPHACGSIPVTDDAAPVGSEAGGERVASRAGNGLAVD